VSLDKHEIAKHLDEIAAIMSLQKAPSFKVGAYTKGARAIEATKQDLERLVAAKALTTLPGIGDSLAALVTELFTTGRSMLLDRLRSELPPAARELGRVATLDQIQRLTDALGVQTLAELEAACVAGRVREVKGFGDKTEARLLERIRAARTAASSLKLAGALATAAELEDALAAALGPVITSIEIVGAARRGEDVVTALELLAVSDEAHAVAQALGRLARVDDVEPAPSGHAAVALTLAARLDEGLPLRLHVAPPEHAGSARLETIGPRDHVELVERATSGRLYASEAALYADAGRMVVPPEVRDDPESVAAAARGPLRLLLASDIQGLVHCHTTWSDGRHSVADMVRAAEALGMRYLTITDHSPTASYANGVGLDRIERQWDEIARVQETTRVRILRGAESDILEDGALDYPDAILERLDIVIASIHNRHGQDEAAMTRRLVRAMRHPVRKIWGHPLGRLLLRRPPVPVRFDEVLDAIVDSGVIVELNGDPNRMDLPTEEARQARRRGVRFVASVDAHAAHETKYLAGAVTLARRAGLGPESVVNTLDTDAFLAAVRPTG